MRVEPPKETLPEAGTVLNPATFYDGEDVFLCYQTSPRLGLMNVVLQFQNIIDFKITPMNVESLKACKYPISPWNFNEIISSDEAVPWAVCTPRFWIISFMDVTVEILFDKVSIIYQERKGNMPNMTLFSALQVMYETLRKGDLGPEISPPS